MWIGLLDRKSWDRRTLFRLRKNARFGLRSEIALFNPPIRLHNNWPTIPQKQLRLPSPTWPPAASLWLHARPTHQPSVAPAKERAPMTNSESGGRGEVLPGTDRSLPGIAENRKKMEIPALYLYQHMCRCTSLHYTGTTSVPTHVLLYGTYCCTHLLLCVRTRASGGRGEAWRGKKRHVGPALA